MYCAWDRASRLREDLKYEARAWCRVEQVVGWRVHQPPMCAPPGRPFERYRLSLYRTDTPDVTDGVSVDELDGVRIVRELTSAGSWGTCPARHPGEGILSVETDRAPL